MANLKPFLSSVGAAVLGALSALSFNDPICHAGADRPGQQRLNLDRPFRLLTQNDRAGQQANGPTYGAPAGPTVGAAPSAPRAAAYCLDRPAGTASAMVPMFGTLNGPTFSS